MFATVLIVFMVKYVFHEKLMSDIRTTSFPACLKVSGHHRRQPEYVASIPVEVSLEFLHRHLISFLFRSRALFGQH